MFEVQLGMSTDCVSLNILIEFLSLGNERIGLGSLVPSLCGFTMLMPPCESCLRGISLGTPPLSCCTPQPATLVTSDLWWLFQAVPQVMK